MYIFSDIDGTLYSPTQHKIPDSAYDAIQKARKNGHKFFLCTGRGLGATLPFLNLEVDGFLFGVGTLIYVEGKRIFSHPLDLEVLQKLVVKMEDLDLGYILEGNAGTYGNSFGYEQVSKHHIDNPMGEEKEKKIMMANGIFALENWHTADPIYKIVIYPHKKGQVEALQEAFPEGINFVESNLGDFTFPPVEISNAELNKATAIQIVMDHYGIDQSQTVGIGDSANDLEMIEFCGCGIAMGNAVQELKDVADYVTSDILEDGMANALKHIGAIE